MSKIRSIEGYFVSKFNEAQDEIYDLKAENDYLKAELEKKTETEVRRLIKQRLGELE